MAWAEIAFSSQFPSAQWQIESVALAALYNSLEIMYHCEKTDNYLLIPQSCWDKYGKLYLYVRDKSTYPETT